MRPPATVTTAESMTADGETRVTLSSRSCAAADDATRTARMQRRDLIERSFVSQRLRRIDARRAARGNVGRQHGDREDDRRDEDERREVLVIVAAWKRRGQECPG